MEEVALSFLATLPKSSFCIPGSFVCTLYYSNLVPPSLTSSNFPSLLNNPCPILCVVFIHKKEKRKEKKKNHAKADSNWPVRQKAKSDQGVLAQSLCSPLDRQLFYCPQASLDKKGVMCPGRSCHVPQVPEDNFSVQIFPERDF